LFAVEEDGVVGPEAVLSFLMFSVLQRNKFLIVHSVLPEYPGHAVFLQANRWDYE
jgi:hypothetical protein